MQLIRAINKSNRSNNNNNQTSSASNNKVVIVAPPNARPSSVTQQKSDNSGQSAAGNVSPSVALPALKKRTSIVKQSVPPPVPARRGSPRSKSKSLGVLRSGRIKLQDSSIDVHRLIKLSSFEQNGCQKVEKWLETIEVPLFVEEKCDSGIPEQIDFKSVKSLIEKFALRDVDTNQSIRKGQKVSDSSLVKRRVNAFNSIGHLKTAKSLNLRTNCSTGDTDSGIDILARMNRKLCGNLSRDGEFV